MAFNLGKFRAIRREQLKKYPYRADYIFEEMFNPFVYKEPFTHLNYNLMCLSMFRHISVTSYLTHYIVTWLLYLFPFNLNKFTFSTTASFPSRPIVQRI